MSFINIFNDEEGAALTEFVVGLPIFILIFSAILSLYQISNASILSMTEANHKLWVASQSTSLAAASPIVAGTNIVSDAISGKFSVMSLMSTGSQAGGIYFDAWAKNEAASLIPGAPGEGVDPHQTIDKIHKNFTDESPAQLLLDDNLLDPDVELKKPTGSIYTVISKVANSLLQVSGAKLGMATGIRYGEVGGYGKEKIIKTPLGKYTVGGASLHLTRNTEATHRFKAVIMARLQHANDEQLDSLLQIEMTPDTSGAPEWGTEDETRETADQCETKKLAYQQCLDKSKEKYEEEWTARCEAQKAQDPESTVNCNPSAMPSFAPGDSLGLGLNGVKSEEIFGNRKHEKKSRYKACEDAIPDCKND